MFEEFLSLLLQIVIAIDVLGAIAYFALGLLRRTRRVRRDFPSPSFWRRLFPRRPGLARPQDVDRLRRVLYSFQDGLS